LEFGAEGTGRNLGGDLMKVRVVRPFQNYPMGAEFDWDDGFASLLVRRGVVERVEEIETASVEERYETANMKTRKRKT